MSFLETLWAAVVAAFVWLGSLAGLGPPSPEAYQGYVEGEYVRIGLPAAGTLAALRVERGDRVPAGQPLFALDDAAECAARDEAAAQVHRAMAQLADLKKGKRPEEQEVVAAQRKQAEASLALSEVELARTERLYASNVVAKSRLDEARATQARDRARLAEMTAQLTTARLAARVDEIAMAEASVATALSKLREAEWRLEQRAAAAPADALVVDTLYRPGEFVAAGAPVVSLLPPGNLKVRFFVPEPKLAGIAIGQAVRVTCDGCGDGFAAAVGYVSPEAEYTPPVIYSQTTRAKLVYLVEARLRDPKARLNPGQPVEVIFEQEMAK
jgi:HlyD family secretion protein